LTECLVWRIFDVKKRGTKNEPGIYDLQRYLIWHTGKNELNKKKHGIGFEEASGVFDDPFSYEVFDEENSADEERYRVTGTVTGIVHG
jgi:hypothetical protein